MNIKSGDSASEALASNLKVWPICKVISVGLSPIAGGVESYRLIVAVSSETLPDLSVARIVTMCGPAEYVALNE